MPASSKIHLPEKIYTPDAMRKAGIRIWGTMTRELWSARELIWRLVYRDISARYRQSVLGYIWAILPPLVTVAIFTFLTSNRVLPIGEMPLPYPVFALWSIGVWQLFSQSLAACTNSLTNASSLVTKINFPKETLVISAVGQPLIDFLIRLLPTILVFFWYEIIPPLAALWIPILLIPVILMAIGLGFFFAIANLAIRDIGNAVGMALTFGMFAAPVLYPPPVTAPFFLVNIINPFSPLLIATQDLLAYGELLHADLLLGAAIFACATFLIGWRIFYLTIPRIAERA